MNTSLVLVADIGGTHARFALANERGTLSDIAVLTCDAHAGFEDVMRTYLARCDAKVRHASIAIANPIDGDTVRMTNREWTFSIEQVRRALGLETLLVVNDFTALASALPLLTPDHRRAIGDGTAQPNEPIAVIGAGTGLGVSGLVLHASGEYVALASEGGHASFAPRDELEDVVLTYARKRYGHVSFERVASGAGLVLIHEALSEHEGAPAPTLTPADIVQRATSASCARCVQVVDVFCAVLGTVASDLALTLGARGGVYIGGGIVPRLGSRFDRSPFRARFEDKGRFSAYLKRVPTWVITHEAPALLGAAAMLNTRLAAASRSAGEKQHAFNDR
ncbi:MAG TPA: glucokinase [Burkholderiaceae bacterium]|nr:glucokinase [Burkholderiaceae bacterium]